MKNIEHHHQVAVVTYLRILEKQKKIVCFFAIPNMGKRNKTIGAMFKAEGLRAGVSDLCIILRDEVVFIEMKPPKNKLKDGTLSKIKMTSLEQDKFIKIINDGSKVSNAYVCYGAIEAKDTINKILKNKEV